jgi:hypothetical protein
MIITDPSQPLPPKDRAGPSTPPAVPPPPPYVAPAPAAPKLNADRYPLYAPPPAHYAGPRARKRFLHAYLCAVFVCFLFALTGNGVSNLAGYHFGRSGWDVNVDGWPIPPEYNTTSCVNGADWGSHDGMDGRSMDYPFAAGASFELPLAADLLFVLSRGAQSGGRVQVITSPFASDYVTVDVTMRYRSRDALRLAGACLLTKREGEYGVGIFVRISHLIPQTPAHLQL